MTAYLDWAATAPPEPEAIAEYSRIAMEYWHNPSSVHEPGRQARAILEEARNRAASALSTDPRTLYFTSGGTEGDHLPLLALLQRSSRGTIACSAVEHAAIAEQAKALEQAGWKTLVIPADREGFISPEAVLAAIRDDTAFIAVMAVNNETGAIQPIKEIVRALEYGRPGKRKPHVHVDAVQAIGKIPFDVNLPGIDSIALSGHKFGGPRGVGILRLAKRIEPFVRGGGQEGGLRPGTENTAGAAALALSLEKAALRVSSGSNGIDVAEYLFGKTVRIPGIEPIPSSRKPSDPRFSPFVAQFYNTRFPGEVLVRSLSDRGIYISTGSACSSKKKRRPVLEAMKLDPVHQQNAFRVSSGCSTSFEEADCFIAALTELLGD